MKITYTLECLPEDSDPRDHFGYDTEEENRAAAEDIRSELNSGNEWAWFCAKVTASVEIAGQTFTGVDYLGGCSYADESAFRADPYFADMRDSAKEALKAELLAAQFRGAIAHDALRRFE